jgi:hypothetical protein
MEHKVISQVIGQLNPDATFFDWWQSNEVEIPFLNSKKMSITFINYIPGQDLNFIADADLALMNFMKLCRGDRNLISEFAYKKCMAYLEEAGFDAEDEVLWKIEDRNEIWNFIYPTDIYVSRRQYKDQDIYISIICECDWDVEHAVQFVFRQGKQLTRLSAYDGHLTDADAFDISDEEDELLSKYNKAGS